MYLYSSIIQIATFVLVVILVTSVIIVIALARFLVVGVDGWQRPLAEALEDLWHESVLAQGDKKSMNARRILRTALYEGAAYAMYIRIYDTNVKC